MKLVFFYSHLLLCLLLASSCGKPEQKKKVEAPKEVVVIPQAPVNDRYPEYRPSNDRPPTPPPMPEPEIPYPSEPAYVIHAYRCYEGDPNTKLNLVKMIKKEKMGWFRRSRYFVYDCHGTYFCDKESILFFQTHAAFEDEMNCFEHAEEQTIFSVCKDSTSTRHSTYKGNLTSLVAVIKGNSTTLYCDSSLSL